MLHLLHAFPFLDTKCHGDVMSHPVIALGPVAQDLLHHPDGKAVASCPGGSGQALLPQPLPCFGASAQLLVHDLLLARDGARIMPLRAGVPHGLAVFAVARCSVGNPEVYTVAVAGAPALVGRWPSECRISLHLLVPPSPFR